METGNIKPLIKISADKDESFEQGAVYFCPAPAQIKGHVVFLPLLEQT